MHDEPSQFDKDTKYLNPTAPMEVQNIIKNTNESDSAILTPDQNNDANKKQLINSNKRSRLSDTNDENMSEENQPSATKDLSSSSANINKNVFNRDSFKSIKTDAENSSDEALDAAQKPNMDHYNPNELMSLMLKMKNNHLIKNEHDSSHQLIPDDQMSLIRTSSNASSTSTTSTSSSSVSALSYSDNHYNNYSINNDSLSSLSSSLSSNSSMSMLNENHFKALIMSAAAAATKNKPAQESPDTKMSYFPGMPNPNEVEMSKTAAAFADQFANIVRSRSSSLSDSSTSSCSSSAGSYSQKGPSKMLDFAAKMISPEFNPPSEASLSQNEFINSIMCNPSAKHLNNPMTATIMKQMINSYQAAFSGTKPAAQNSAEMNLSEKLAENKAQTQKFLTPETKNEEIKAKINEVANKTSQSPSSTPCKVCGDEASGFHYGVDSCEGCKGFFRRCITQGMNHQCTNNQQCEMTPFSRNSCQFCRLKKCFAVGMSREASRLGRRPKRPKDEAGSFDSSCNNSNMDTPNTTPLKQMCGMRQMGEMHKSSPKNSNEAQSNEEQSSQAADALKESVTMSLSSSLSSNMKIGDERSSSLVQSLEFNAGVSAQPPFKLDSFYENQPAAAKVNSPVSKLEFDKVSPDSDKLKSSDECKDLLMVNKQIEPPVAMKNYTESLKIQTSAAQLQKETAQQQMQQIEMLTKLISISDRHTSIERTNELEYIRSAIIESHGMICQTTSEKIRRRYAERPPVRVSYSPVKETQNWDNFIKAMVPLILDVVKFCKYIPGFNHILYSDQVQLLKQGTFEVICVNSFMLVDAQNKLMITPDMEFIMDSNTLRMVPLGFFMSDVFELGLQVSQLKLTDAEIALYNAILIMNPDRGDLHDKDSVEELQSTLLHVLFKHLKYYRSDGIDLFFKLLKLIPAIQELSRRHSEALNTVQASNSYRNTPQAVTTPTTNDTADHQHYNEAANSFLKNELKEKKAKI